MKNGDPHLWTLLKRLGLIFMVYLLARVVFYFIYSSQFEGAGSGDVLSAFVQGVRFDLSAILLSNALVIILSLLPLPTRSRSGYQGLLSWVFILSNLPWIILICIDLEYFRFTTSRLNAEVLNYGFDIRALLGQYFKDFWFYLIPLAIVIFLLYRLTKAKRHADERKMNWVRGSVLFLLGMAVIIVGFRGGLQPRPLTSIHALDHMPQRLVPLAVNTPFNVMTTLSEGSEAEYDYYQPDELSKHFDFCRSHGYADTTIQIATEKPNVVLIVLESFSQSYMGCYGAEESATPFLDSLANYSILFENMTANGVRSVDGIPAILAGIPSLGTKSFINSPYQTNRVEGIGTHLKAKGYQTAFFHGGNNGTFNFDKFSRLAGFDDYYGRDEYGNDNDFDGNWGIWDEPFFLYSAEMMSQSQEPFGSVLYSISSHHPFSIPQKASEKYNHLSNDLLKSISYTDHALREFFDRVQNSEWYKNTMFIITSDHCGPRNNMTDARTHDKYDIPLLIFNPQDEVGQRFNHKVQQVDILPTVLEIINFEDVACLFGEHLMDRNADRKICHYLGGIFQIQDDRHILDYNGESTAALYVRIGKERQRIDNDIVEKELLADLKSVIQTYHESLRNNSLANKKW